jgi:hypothetical protein
MVWLAVDKNEQEWVFNSIPARFRNQVWRDPMFGYEMQLPQGSIEKLIGRKLNWEDEPVEI